MSTASVACGVLGVGGNKGAVAVSFTLHRRRIACVCSHFAAHQVPPPAALIPTTRRVCRMEADLCDAGHAVLAGVQAVLAVLAVMRCDLAVHFRTPTARETASTTRARGT